MRENSSGFSKLNSLVTPAEAVALDAVCFYQSKSTGFGIWYTASDLVNVRLPLLTSIENTLEVV